MQESPGSGGESMHPASRILIWLAFAFGVPWLRPFELAAVVVVLSLVLLLRYPGSYFKLLRRARWLLVTLILVYAFVTPGEALMSDWNAYGPSREGLLSGSVQALRLVALLAGLAFLLATSNRDRILAGLYVLLRPFKILGLDVDRVAVRVWLTLHYAEQAGPSGASEWLARLQAAAANDVDPRLSAVRLEMGEFTGADFLVLLTAMLTLGLLLARGVT